MTASSTRAVSERAAMLKLARFGAAMLRAHRGTQPCAVGDIDGATAEAGALECGVLEARHVTQPCCESCVCADVGLPGECYFVPDDVRSAIDAARVRLGDVEDRVWTPESHLDAQQDRAHTPEDVRPCRRGKPDSLTEALRRLMPLIERAMGGYVFTAEKAGEVAADMQTLRHSIGATQGDAE